MPSKRTPPIDTEVLLKILMDMDLMIEYLHKQVTVLLTKASLDDAGLSATVKRLSKNYDTDKRFDGMRYRAFFRKDNEK